MSSSSVTIIITSIHGNSAKDKNHTKMKATKTTYDVYGCPEPCWVVGSEDTYVRIAPFYHIIGKNTLLVSEYVDGEFNSSEEINGDFDSLTASDAIRIAKQHSVYIY